MREHLTGKKRNWRRAVVLAALLGILCIPLANEITRRVGARFLGTLVDGDASIAKVRLGLRKVRVEQITVWSTNCEEPTLSVRELTAELSILNGFRRGVWVETIVVDRPQLQLHFDEAGKLLTRLPNRATNDMPAEPVSTIPFERLRVNNARLVIHQPGRESLDIDRMVLVADSEARQLSVDATIPKLFAGEVQFHSNFDITSLKGSSELTISGLRATSDELVLLPLWPNRINAQPWSASASIEVKQSGSLADPKKLGITFQLRDLVVSTVERSGIVEASAVASISNGALRARTSGRLLGGTFEADYVGSLYDELHGTLAFACNGLNTRSLPGGLIPEHVRAELDANVKLTAVLADSMLRLKGSARSKVVHANVHGIVIAPTVAEVHVDGTIDLEGTSDRSSGLLTATVLSDGVSLEQLSAVDRELPSSSRHNVSASNPPHVTPRLPDFVRPAGHVRGAVRIKIPLASLDDPRTFLANGTLDATGVEVNDVIVKHGKGDFQFDGDRLSVDFRNMEIVDSVNGEQSSVSVVASGNLQSDAPVRVELRLNRLSAATIGRLANFRDKKIDGELLAHAVLQCDSDRLSHVEAWRGNAVLQAKSIRISEQTVAHCEAHYRVAHGIASLNQLRGHLFGGKLTGNGTCQLVSPFTFRGSTSLNGVDLSGIASLAGKSHQHTNGNMDISFVADGEIATNQWRGRGQVTGTELHFGNQPFDDTRFDLMVAPDSIVASCPPNGFLGGNCEFTAKLPNNKFDGTPALAESIGPSLSGRLSDISLPAMARIAGLKERIEGTVSCEFAAHSLSDLALLDVVAVLDSPGVAIRNASLNKIHANVTVRDGQVDTQLNALGFGGEFSLRANADLMQLASLKAEALQEISALPVRAQAIVSNVKLQELWPVIGQQDQLRPLRGSFTVSLERGDAERQQKTLATGKVKLRDLRWDNVLWSNQLQADFVVGENLLEVRQFAGPFAGGRVHARAKISLDSPMNGSFEFSTSRVSLKKALVPIDRRGELASGLVSVRVHGRLGARPSGRAMVSMDRGTAGPIALTRLRVPVDWSLDPAARSIHWRTTNAGVELGGGRVVTNARGRWNGKLDMTLTTTARRVDTGRILHGNSTAGGGYLDGSFRLRAKRATVANDFTGKFDATLSDASSLQIPVVSDLTRFLTTLPTTTSYDESRIQGRLGNGIVHLDRVTLSAANAQVHAEGTVTLQGRLNLQVMAKTDKTGPADKLLKLADSPLLMAAPTPLALVAKANHALKDRVIHLRIGGTAARPMIRLEPGRQIGQEAIKFFMNQAIAFRNKSNDLSFH